MALRLKEIRKKSGLTLDELAQKSGLSKRSLCAYEANTSDIKSNNLLILAKTLKCDPMELLEGYEQKQEPTNEEPLIPQERVKELNELIKLFQRQLDILGRAITEKGENNSD